MRRSMNPHRGGVLALAALVTCVVGFSTFGQSADVEFRAVAASGTECASAGSSPATCDWYLDNANGIVLHRTPQDVKWEAYVSDFGDVGVSQPTGIQLYQVGLACSSLDNGTVPLEPIVTACSGSPIPAGEFCMDVDTARADWPFANSINPLDTCNRELFCPDEFPAKLYCGALSFPPPVPDPGPGSAYYGATYAATVPAGARGVFQVRPFCDEDTTFLRDGSGAQIEPVELIAMRLEVMVGRCCGAVGFDFMCGDGVTFDECTAAGGTFIPGQTCTGLDDDIDGLDNACDVCSVDADCDDGLYCTGQEFCFGGQCIVQDKPCTSPYRSCNEDTDSCECSGLCQGVGDGDFNANDIVNLPDHAALVECLDAGQPYPVGSCCSLLDMNADGFVDLIDAAEFQNAFMTSP